MTETQRRALLTVYGMSNPQAQQRLLQAFPEVFVPQFLRLSPTGIMARG